MSTAREHKVSEVLCIDNDAYLFDIALFLNKALSRGMHVARRFAELIGPMLGGDDPIEMAYHLHAATGFEFRNNAEQEPRAQISTGEYRLSSCDSKIQEALNELYLYEEEQEEDNPDAVPEAAWDYMNSSEYEEYEEYDKYEEEEEEELDEEEDSYVIPVEEEVSPPDFW